MNDRTQLFERTPIPKAVAQLAVPAIIGQMITIIYNLADTYFVGQLNQNAQVAAVTLSMPIFLSFMAVSNLFGVGGGSAASRSLGEKKSDQAGRAAALSFWMCVCVSLLISLLVGLFRGPLMSFMGADESTRGYTERYLFWTVVVGGLPTALNPLLAYLIRSDGASRQAGLGMSLGGALNIVLDPIMIFGFGLQVEGAAIATAVSNTVATAYFLIYIARHRGQTVVRLRPAADLMDFALLKEIVTVGLPSFTLSILSTVSNIAVNKLMSPYGSAALAAVGVSKKINTAAYSVVLGLSQGVLPLVAYNYAAGNSKRLKNTILFTLASGLGVAAAFVVVFQTLAQPVSALFLKDPEAIGISGRFLRIICLAIPTTSLINLTITIFQGLGRKLQPFVISLLRKGTVDVLLMIALESAMGLYGILWATPVADCIAATTALLLLFGYARSTQNKEKNDNKGGSVSWRLSR